MVEDLQARARHAAAKRLAEDINALFASSRPALNEEASAFVWVLGADGWQQQPYLTFANGVNKAEGQHPPAFKSLDQAVNMTVKAVKRVYPDHANMEVIWRVPPSCDQMDGVIFDMTKDEKATNVRPDTLLYPMVRARILAVPVGAMVLGPAEYNMLMVAQGETN
jgi:hypothetical protein